MLLAAGMPFAVKNGNSARGVGARARSPLAPPSRGSLSRPRSPSPEEGLDLAGDPSTEQCNTASSSSEDENSDASEDDAVAIADDSAHNNDDDAQEAITLSSRETSLSPIWLPIDDTGQFIDSPVAPVIDFDFDSHFADTELAGDRLSVVVCDGFPVVT